jgi:hypothetical protein
MPSCWTYAMRKERERLFTGDYWFYGAVAVLLFVIWAFFAGPAGW